MDLEEQQRTKPVKFVKHPWVKTSWAKTTMTKLMETLLTNIWKRKIIFPTTTSGPSSHLLFQDG